MTEALDDRILHALQLAPRISFRQLGDIVGAPEQTIARRYRRMRGDGLVRVVGVVNPAVYGNAEWIVRVHARPGDLPRIAEALVRRPEVIHANVHSGSTELVCVIRAPLGQGGDGLLQRLPRTTSVLHVDIDLILHEFDDPATSPWTALGHGLSRAEAEAVLRSRDTTVTGDVLVPTAEDTPLLAALADDGRTPNAQLAAATGWSSARVARRITALREAGTLRYDVDLLPESLGFNLNAMLWLSAAPKNVHRAGERIAAHAEIASCTAVSGRHNLMAVVICRDVAHLYAYLTNHLAAVEHVDSYEVSIRSQRLKQTTSVVSGGRLVHAPSQGNSAKKASMPGTSDR